MKIRNLLVLAITMALATLCAQAQERDGSLTYTDHAKQSITISRFGTVLSFKDGTGNEIVPQHTYRVCPCGDRSRCVDSAAPTVGTKATLNVGFPKRGTQLRKGQTLIIKATVSLEGLTLRRRLAWVAGSSVVEIVETNLGRKAAICAFDESTIVLTGMMCPRPPEGLREAPPSFKCPPPPLFREFVNPRNWQLVFRSDLDLSRLLTPAPR